MAGPAMPVDRMRIDPEKRSHVIHGQIFDLVLHGRDSRHLRLSVGRESLEVGGVNAVDALFAAGVPDVESRKIATLDHFKDSFFGASEAFGALFHGEIER